MTDLDALLAEIAASPAVGPFREDITAEQAAKRFSNKDLAIFHNHNPNGIAAEWAELGDRLVAFGRGFFAYGDMGFLANELRRLSDYKRKRVNSIELSVVIKLIRQTIDQGNKFLADNASNKGD